LAAYEEFVAPVTKKSTDLVGFMIMVYTQRFLEGFSGFPAYGTAVPMLCDQFVADLRDLFRGVELT
jgi:hypothetical protein